MNGWTAQWPGVAQESQGRPAAESDTSFGEPFVVGGYQAQEGDTETQCFYLFPKVDWGQYPALPLAAYRSVVSGVDALPLDLGQSPQVTVRQSFPFALAILPRALNGPRGLVVVFEPPAQAETAGVRPDPSQEELERHVKGVLEAARDERFEDGMESSISRTLVPLVERYQTELAESLFYWLVPGRASPRVTAESLRWLGDMDHAPSHNWRRRLLERCLEAPSVAVRDAAGVGLASMDDPQAIPAVKDAIAREPSAELRQCLQQVLAQLEGKPGWRCF